MRYRILFILLLGSLLCGCKRDYYEIGDRKLRIYTDLDKLTEADNVRAIKLEGKGLQEFPAELYRFKNLEFLNLSDNNIRVLPDSISIFKNLTALSINDNPLIELPNTITTLANLRVVSTMGTDIAEMPKDFNKLTNLKYCVVGRMKNLSYEELQKLEKNMPWCNFISSVY